MKTSANLRHAKEATGPCDIADCQTDATGGHMTTPGYWRFRSAEPSSGQGLSGDTQKHGAAMTLVRDKQRSCNSCVVYCTAPKQ